MRTLHAILLLAVLVAAGTASAHTDTTVKPTANIGNTVYNGQVGTPVTFSGAASTAQAGHTITSYSWAFSDANCNNAVTGRECSASGSTASHTVAAAATYHVPLPVVDNPGHGDSATASAVIAAADSTAPTITGTLPTTGTAGQALVVTMQVVDNIALRNVTLHHGNDAAGDGFSNDADISTAMSRVTGTNNYTATISGTSVTSTLGFFVEAIDTSSNTARFPLAGASSGSGAGSVRDGHQTLSLADSVPPVITAITGSTVTIVSGSGVSIPVQATITDGSAVTANLFYRSVGATDFPATQSVAGVAAGSTYTFTIPASAFPTASQFQYYIEARDAASTPNIARLPASNHLTAPLTVTILRTPVVTHTALGAQSITSGNGISLSATVTDDGTVSSVTTKARLGTTGSFTDVAMTQSGTTWTGTIPASVLTASGTVQYYIEAVDSTTAVGRSPTTAPTSLHSFALTVTTPTTGGGGGGGGGGGSTGGTGGSTTDATLPSILTFAPTGNVTTNPPTITATYSDNIGVVAGTVTLKLDGASVTPTATATSLTFTPATALSVGEHTVELTLKDAANNLASKTWTFTISAPVTATPTPTTTTPAPTPTPRPTVSPTTPAVTPTTAVTPILTPTTVVSPVVTTTTTTTPSASPTATSSPTTKAPTSGEAPAAEKKPGRIPGFEVVALAGAVGVALLVLRRR